jgi:hypothetical protein
MKVKLFRCFIAIIALGLGLQPLELAAQAFSSCDQWASWNNNGYTIYNNIWGSGAGTQCIWANSYSNWGVTANHPNTGGIKSYPNVSRSLSINVSQLASATSSFNVTRPSSGSYITAYDIWYNNYAYEVMLWMNRTGAVNPISYNWDGNGNPIPVVTNLNVGGHTWNVYQGTNGSAQVYSFVRTSNTNSGTVNIKAISDWLRNNGWFGDVNLHQIQFGFEITSSSGGLSFTVNSYSLSYSSGGGTTYYKFQNRATGLYIDGMGRTSNGSNCGQWSNSSSYNQQWAIVSAGSYVKLRNRATGLYLDGMGRTTNGSTAGQWSNSSSYNQQWTQTTSGGYSRFQNRATGLYLDGMGRTSNGSDLGQWGNSNSYNQQWAVTTVSSKAATPNEGDLVETTEQQPATFALHQNYPNPFNPETKISYQLAEAGKVKLEIFDMLGRRIRTLVDGDAPAGFYDVHWNAADDFGNRVPSGVYLYTIKVTAGATVFSDSRKMLLVK